MTFQQEYEYTAVDNVEHWYMPECVDRDIVKFKARANAMTYPERVVWVHPHSYSENCTFRGDEEECKIVNLPITNDPLTI